MIHLSFNPRINDIFTIIFSFNQFLRVYDSRCDNYNYFFFQQKTVYNKSENIMVKAIFFIIIRKIYLTNFKWDETEKTKL